MPRMSLCRFAGQAPSHRPVGRDSEGAVLGFNGQPVSLTVDAPSETTTSTANLGLVIGLGPVPQPQMNIVYLIDISGSTSDSFAGTLSAI